MNERVRIITEQALALPASEREELLIALAASLGKQPYAEDEAGEPGAAPYRLSPDEAEAEREGQEQARRGEFVSADEVAAFYKRYGL